ncbi:MAG: hypothetical protein SCK70_03260 [bacterium]|nr:hypothetical protein [bacterium]
MNVQHRDQQLLVSLLLLFFCFTPLFGQNQDQRADTSKSANLESNSIEELSAMVELDGDIVLDAINIEAIIEKPRVAIIPKRLEPEFGDLEFVDRSFEAELKSVREQAIFEDDRLFQPRKIGNLKKQISNKQPTKNDAENRTSKSEK